MKFNPSSMKSYITILLKISILIQLLFVFIQTDAQTKGLIVEPATGPGTSILDPNLDGYVSNTSFGFINNDKDESEIPYIPLIFPGTEPPTDINNGPNCGFSDFVESDYEDPAQSFIDAADNWLFRLRMGNIAPNSKSYSILIDADGLFGNNPGNPAYTTQNPGFEMEIVLATNFGVYIYDLRDDPVNCTPVISYDGHTNYQKAVAHSEICDELNFFLDFFVEWDDITGWFGYDQNTPMRYVLVDNMAANTSTICSPSSASDVGGVTDCVSLEECFSEIIDYQNPCPPGNINTALCMGISECPIITSSTIQGIDDLSGTCDEEDGTEIRLYINGDYIVSTFLIDSLWNIIDITPPLTGGDTIVVTAISPDESESEDCGFTIVTETCTNPPLSAYHCGKSIQGLADAGALIRVYYGNGTTPLNPGGGTIFATGTPNTITASTLPSLLSPSTDNFLWKCTADGPSTGCNSAGPACLANGSYRITAQLPGQCESEPYYLCIGTTTLTSTPTISTTPILNSTSIITGTIPAPDNVSNVLVILYVNGIQTYQTLSTAGGNWIINDISLNACDQIYVRAIVNGKCISDLSPTVSVSGGQTSPPIITGDYCVNANVNTVTGYSTEAAGTWVQLYIGTTPEGLPVQVESNGTWTKTGLNLPIGTTFRAKAVADCKTESEYSADVTITTQTTSTASITSIPVTEGDNTVSGTGSDGDIITLYIDGWPVYLDVAETMIAQTTVIGTNWTINGIHSGALYAGGELTLTVQSGANCESDPIGSVIVQCNLPIDNLSLVPIENEYCSIIENGQFIVYNTQPYVIYTPVLVSDSSIIGYSGLGNGDSIILNTFSLTDNPTFITVKAEKISPVSCITYNTDDISLIINPLPLMKTYSPNISDVCEGASLEILISNSENGVEYRLYDDSDNQVGASVTGNGSDITLNTGPILGSIVLELRAYYIGALKECPIVLGDVNITMLPCSADLSITKTVDNPTANVGEQVVFTLTVTNNGPSNATGVSVTDNIPTGYTYVSNTPSTGTYNNGTGIWTIGNLNNGSTATLDITVTVNASGTYTNTASVDGTEGDPTPGNDSDSEAVTPVAQADLSITKTVDNPTANVGEQVVFTLTVTNNGPSNATGVSVTDNIPTGYTYVSNTPSTGTYNNGTGIWTIGNLNNGSTATLDITVTVNASGTYTNTASVDGTEGDPTPGNDSDSEAVTPVSQADLSITKTVDNPTANVGEQVVFTLTVTNNGPSNATGVSVTDNIPSGYTYVSNTPSTGTFNNGTGIWTIGNLNNGSTATLDITVTVNASGTYTNTASVDGTEGDPTPGNDSDSEAVTPVAQADLSITKTVDNPTANVGEQVVFTITVTNNGPSNATGVSVTDNIPSGYTYVSNTPSTGTYNNGTGIWTIGNLNNGSTATLDITVTVNASGTYTNTASVDGTEGDPTPGNDSDSEAVTPVAQADLSITKTVDNPTANVGEQVVFTLTVTNDGPSNATGVSVTDNIPTGYTYVSNSASTGTYNNGTGIWTIGNLNNGSTATLDITVTVNASGTYTNTASVDGTEDDPTPGNDSDSETVTPVAQADLSISKTVDNTTANVGEQVVFTITVTNNGPSNATGVSVTDNIPSGYTYVSNSASTGTYNNGTGIWTIGNLNNGSTATLDITVTVNASGTYTNTASVDGTEGDPTPGNDSDSETVTPVAQADLSITKTVDNPTANVGEQVVFTLTVTNNGPSNATGVSVTDNIPTGYTYVSNTPSTGTYNNGTGIWTIGNLNNGSTATLDITVTVNASGTYTNTASVDGTEGDPTPGNDSDSEAVTPVAQADLSITKTVDNPTANVGEQVVFTLTVTNNGPSNATGVSVTDNIPTGYTYVSNTQSTGTYNNGTGIWTIGNLNNGSTATLDITVTVNASGTYTNTASVDGTEGDPTPGNDSDSEAVTPVAQADLSITKTVDNPTANVGEQVVFTLTVTNNGPSNATGVSVTDNIPTGYTYVSNSPSTGTYDNGTGIWTIGNLNNGSTATLDITVTVNASGTYTNTASVDGTEGDPTPGNDSDSETVTPVAQADLSITKTVDNPTANVGEQVVFTLTVTNNGPSNATGVSVTDNIPTGYTYVSNSASTGTYNNGTGIWTIGNLNNGSTATLDITVTVNASGTYTNTASVDGTEGDPTPGNDSDSETVTPVAQADLSITKTVDNPTANVGEQVVFTLTVTNNGPSNATGVSVTDNIPSGYTYVSNTPSTGTYNNGTGIWTIGNLNNGSTATLDITVTVNTSGTYTNTASVDGTEGDPTPGNDSDSETVTPVAQADLSITKTVDNATANVGEQVLFTITVTNNGPSAAENVVVTDNLPDGFTFVSANPSTGTWAAPDWTIGTMANGASEALLITATVNASGNYTNIASVISTTDDPIPGDEEDEITVNPTSQADLVITKTVDNTTANVGEQVVFTITVTNNGPSAAENVVVTDNLPDGFTFVSANPSTGTWAAPDWTIGTMADGATETLLITATVNPSGNYSNIATVTSTTDDPIPGDEEDDITVNPTSQADLVITKTVDNATANVGEEVVFTITVTNNGPSAAENVVVTDNLPDGFTFVSANPSTGTWTTPDWAIGTMADGASETLLITATVNASGNYTNIATVTSSTDDPIPGDEEDDITVNPTSQADLVITKTVDNTTANVGEQVVFTITVTNNGPSAAENVVVTDNLPDGFTFVSANPSTGTWAAPDWTIGTMADGATETLLITATVNPSGNYSNIATVTSTTDDPIPGDEEDEITVNPTSQADLVITKTVDNATANVGEQVVFTITVTNNGPSAAENVVVTDNLPDGFTFVSANPSTGTWTTPDWTIGTMADGASETLLITATVNASGNYTNIATVTSSTDDPIPGDEEDDITVNPTSQADLVITKTVDNATANVGEQVVFTITVTNNGPSAAENVVVTDNLPDGFTFVSANPSTGTWAAPDWTIGTMADGATETLLITATVNPSGNYSNIATVTSTTDDPIPGDEEDEITVNPTSQADLVITKTVDNATANVGEQVVFTITVTNNGPSAAENVVVTDNLPDGFTFVSANPSTGTWAAPDWTIGTMADGATETILITATVNASGNYTNITTCTSENVDNNIENNTDSVSVEVLNEISIPEGFSPNNDGINDFFVIQGLENYPDNHIVIINRWGNKVFERVGYNNDWDGKSIYGITIGGNELPVGTYFYILYLTEQDEPIKGYVYLSR